MGRLNLDGMREMADERTVLVWHLQHNHYPPVPLSMVEPCLVAIALALDDDWSTEVELPEGTTYKGRATAPVWAIVEQHHLEGFLV